MLNPKSLLKVLPIVLLSFGPIVGMSEVARSQSSETGRTISQSPTQPTQSPTRFLSENSPRGLVEQVLQHVERNYVDPKFNGQNWNRLRQSYLSRSYNSYNEAYRAINEILKRLGDPFTRFYDPLAYKSLQVPDLVGIGLRVANQGENREVTVVEAIGDSPSLKAGILPGDILTQIDGVSVRAKEVIDVARLLRGNAGTVVTLELLRQGKPITLKVQRAQIPLRPIRYRVEETAIGHIGYIRCSEFNVNAQADMKAAIVALEKQNLKGYVLDLRGNPGGLLAAGTEIVRMWLDEGVIYTVITRDAPANPERANNQAMTQKPLIVLIDGNSSSASEIVAAALQENQRASLVGTNTNGNTSIQAVLPLQNETGLAVTLGKWLTPTGRDIHGKGLTPDVVIELTEQQQRDLSKDPSKLGTMADPQFAKAVETLGHKVEISQ